MQIEHETQKRARRPFLCDGCGLVVDRSMVYYHGLNAATNEPARVCEACYRESEVEDDEVQ